MVCEVTNHRNKCLLHCRMLSVYFTLQDTTVFHFHFLTPHSESVQFQGTKIIRSKSSEIVGLLPPCAGTGNVPKYVQTEHTSSG